MKIYGIKNCGSVRKALAFYDAKGVSYEFIDLNKHPPHKEQLEVWLQYFDIDTLLNHKGRTYQTLGLKHMNLDEEAKKEWLIKEPKLFKRPIIQKGTRVIAVGFDEETLSNTL